MQKLAYIISSVDAAQIAVDILKQAGIAESELSLIAKDSNDLKDLPEPNIEDHSDVVPAVKRGAALGGVAGIMAGLAVTAFPLAGVVVGGAAVVAGTGVFGVGYGAFVSALIGSSVDNTALDKFELAIEEGNILLIISAKSGDVDQISQEIDHLSGVQSMGKIDSLSASI